MAQQLTKGKQQFFDGNGQVLAGGSVETYTPGTLTQKVTYQDSGLTTANTNPITLDSAGECVMWGEGLFRLIVKDSLGNLVYDQDASSDTSTSQLSLAQNLPWLDVATYWSDSPQYASATSFIVAGNVATRYVVNRRVQATVSAGYIYGSISGVSYSTQTTVTVQWDSTELDNTLTAIALAAWEGTVAVPASQVGTQQAVPRSQGDNIYLQTGAQNSITETSIADAGTITQAQAGLNLNLAGNATLPDPTTCSGAFYQIRGIAGSVLTTPLNNIYLPDGTTSTTYTFEYASTERITILSDGTNWYVVNQSGRYQIPAAVNPNEAVTFGYTESSYSPLVTVTAGTTYSFGSMGSGSTTSASYAQVVAAHFWYPGSYRITSNFTVSGGGNQIYYQIYKNGAPYGTAHTSTASSGSFTDDITVVAGDEIEIYLHNQYAGDTVAVTASNVYSAVAPWAFPFK